MKLRPSSYSPGDVLSAVQVAMLTLRRCQTKIQDKDDHALYATCQRTATWSLFDSAEASSYSCDLCYLLYHRSDGHTWEEAPHAAAVRLYDCATSSERLLRASSHDDTYEHVATLLLQALPPCPLPPSWEISCPRCAWADGIEPEQSYRARLALIELTEIMATLHPDAWVMTLAHERAWYAAGTELLSAALERQVSE